MQKRYRETASDSMKQEYETFMKITPCEVCKGQRLKATSLAVTVGGINIFRMTDMSIVKLKAFLDNLVLSPVQHDNWGADIEGNQGKTGLPCERRS